MPSDLTPVVGDDLPELRRLIRTADLVAYAGATWDWHRLHYDQDFTRSRGFDRPVVDGQMLGALLAEQVQDALGPMARIVRLAFRFRTPVLADEEVVVTGAITDITEDGDGVLVTVVQSVEAPGGTAIRDAVTVARVRS